MTEVSFAKSFLATLDNRPIKISPDHVEDPRNYPSRSAYILPKQAKPFPKRQKLNSEGQHSLTVNLKSLRNPPLDITLLSQSPNTSILNLKEEISAKENIPIEKLRILYKKRPVQDSKVLRDVVGEENKAEFSVMVIGGAETAAKKEDKTGVTNAKVVSDEASEPQVLDTEEFWADLKGYLLQRLRNEQQAEKAFAIFRKGWESNHG